MQEQLPTDVFKERTGTYLQRVLGGIPISPLGIVVPNERGYQFCG
jgi:hypothetical protein